MELTSRQIQSYIWDRELIGDKMVFLSGPRQVGKTTFAKSLLNAGTKGGYSNWDSPEIRKSYAKDTYFFLKDKKGGEPYLVIFDEIHKRSKWKDILKGIYDTVDSTCKILVTGSARLELFRKSGDSLVGRYTHFHMMPISLSELENFPIETLWLCSKEDWEKPWESFLHRIKSKKASGNPFDHLFKFGGLPEPLVKGSERFLLKWKREYLSLLLTEDMRELTNIKEIDTVEKIITLLPDRIGSPLSVASLSRDVESTYPTVKNHLLQLEKLWLLFSIRPWNKNMNRALKKEKKCYFTNWIYAGGEAQIFENMIASNLLRACTIWTDLAYGIAELWYVRSFDGKEVDFLITLNSKPALLVEAKLSKDVISKPSRNFRERFDVPLIQVLKKPSLFRMDSPHELVISAEHFLSVLP